MSNYPDGMPNGFETEIAIKCKVCNHAWEVAAISEFGTAEMLDPADGQCPECGSWETE